MLHISKKNYLLLTLWHMIYRSPTSSRMPASTTISTDAPTCNFVVFIYYSYMQCSGAMATGFGGLCRRFMRRSSQPKELPPRISYLKYDLTKVGVLNSIAGLWKLPFKTFISKIGTYGPWEKCIIPVRVSIKQWTIRGLVNTKNITLSI